MTRFKFFILSFCLVLSAHQVSAQVKVKDSTIKTVLVNLGYSYQFPMKDMAERFGNNSNLNFGVNFKSKTNYLFGVEGALLFGNQIRQENFLENVKNSGGFILDGNGNEAVIGIFQRGWSTQLTVGKIWNIFASNPNSGITTKVGLGYLEHKIKIVDPDNVIPQFQGDYKKGYDYLTSGLMLSQFIGYQYLGNNNMINFFAGFEVVEAFTQGRRSYIFELKGPNDGKRLDILIGLKGGITLPLYKKEPNDFYYD